MEEKQELCDCGELLDVIHSCPLGRKDQDKVRTHMPKMAPTDRVKSFDEVELGLTEELAISEALRCLGCEVESCVACRICVEVCPNACIHIESEKTETGKKYVSSYEMDASTCLFCGHCVEACPTRTLCHTKEYELSVFSKEEMRYRMKGKDGQSSAAGVGQEDSREKTES